MKRRYSRNHPLWPVYDLQKQIIKRGGKINRYSDLLAYFENISLEPLLKPFDILLNMAYNNGPWNNKNYNDTQTLIKPEILTYNKKQSIILNDNTFRKKINEPIIPGCSIEIPDYLKNEKEKSENGYFLNDNELVIRKNEISHIIILDSKYIDIFRLIKNNYTPEKEKMKKNKNLLPSIIITIAIIIVALLYALVNRYEIDYPLRIDKWTGTMIRLEYKK